LTGKVRAFLEKEMNHLDVREAAVFGGHVWM
jgi:hypothetical protein